MAEPKEIKINIQPVVDTEAGAKLKDQLAAISAGFTAMAEQTKPAFESISKGFAEVAKGFKKPLNQKDMALQPGITQEQICAAFGVPKEMIGLTGPDFMDAVNQAAFDGTLTGEAFVSVDGGKLSNWSPEIHAGDDTGLVPMDQCPSNLSPYVPGQLGINSFLTEKTTAPVSGWEGKTSAEILADIQKAIGAYKNAPMPAPLLPPIVEPQGPVKAKSVKVAKLDAQGNPTGEWTELGAALKDFTVQYVPVKTAETGSLGQQIALQQLEVEMQAEKEQLGAFIGVDLGPDSDTIVTLDKHPSAAGEVQVSVSKTDGTPVKQVILSKGAVKTLADQMVSGMPQPPLWVHNPEKKIGTATLSNHASGLAVDINANSYITASGGLMGPPDLLHFEPSDIPAYPKFPEFSVKKGGISFTKMPEDKVSQTHKLAHGATLIEYPDGMATLDLPGTVTVPGKAICTLYGKFTLPIGQAKQIAGLEPLETVDVLDSTTQWAYGQPFVWHPDHGWRPKDEVHAAPTTWYGEDGMELETVSTGTELTDADLVAANRVWCSWHDQHWSDPAHALGEVFECGSGAYSRPSTPLEDKQALARRQMMRETGLL